MGRCSTCGHRQHQHDVHFARRTGKCQKRGCDCLLYTPAMLPVGWKYAKAFFAELRERIESQ